MNHAQRLALNACTAAAAMLAIYSPALATGAPEDVSRHISERRSAIDSAELVLLPHGFELRNLTGEQDISHFGCHYAVSNRTDLDSLLEVVANAKLESTPASDGYAGQILIRLNEVNATHTIVLDQDFDNANASGEYRLTEHGATSTTPIQAASKTERDLRSWAAQHRPLAASHCGK